MAKQITKKFQICCDETNCLAILVAIFVVPTVHMGFEKKTSHKTVKSFNYIDVKGMTKLSQKGGFRKNNHVTP